MTGEMEKTTAFLCKLKEFSSLDDRVVSYRTSPEFRFGGRNWWLRLYPNSRNEYSAVSVSESDIVLYLHLLSDRVPPFKVRYTVGIRTEKGATQKRGTGTHTFDRYSKPLRVRIIERSELSQRRVEFLPRDVLTLALELQLEDASSETVLKTTYFEEIAKSNVADASVQARVERNVADVSVQATFEEILACGGKGEPTEKTGPSKIIEDVGKLWPNGDHTDVLLKVRDVEFKAHKTILLARTPVLSAMFEHDTVEKASGEVSIEDCEPKVFEQLLHFIYKGAPSELTAKNAPALYVLADKYLVSELKALCVRCMRDNLCLDTFFDTLTLSLMHREDELLKTVTDFLSKHMTRVLKTVEWQRFTVEHKTWANETQIRAIELIEARYKALVDRSI